MKRPPSSSEMDASGLVPRREANRSQKQSGPYPTAPSQAVIDAFLDHVRQTGQPETFPTIERQPPPPYSTPVILCKFDVDRSKRPQKDMAPCAICSPFKEKCLHHMLLVYYPDEGVIRAIGSECGERIENGEEYRQAKKNYDLERQRKQAEAYIETNLPRVPRTSYDLKRLERAAREAGRLHARFRSEAGTIIKVLRRVGDDNGGLLAVDAVLLNADGEGPGAFGGGLRSAKEYFGPLKRCAFSKQSL